MNKDLMRWALAVAELRGKYAEKSYVSSDARELLAEVTRLHDIVLKSLGIDDKPVATDDIADFDAYTAASQVAS